MKKQATEPKKTLSEHEIWADDAMRKAEKDFELKAVSRKWSIRKMQDGTEVCSWTFDLKDGQIGGSLTFGESFSDCYLALVTGIGLQKHPFKNTISSLLRDLITVAHTDMRRNSLGEIAVRGWLWHMMVGNTPREEALQKIIRDFHIRENIDDVYKIHELRKGKIH